MSRWLLAALIAVAALALHALPLAQAQGADPPASAAGSLRLTGAGGDATLRFPFALAADGQVYAKLLPTPWNPVLPSGAANGSIAADRSAGVRGWWVQLTIEPAGSAPVALGLFADSGASQAVLLPGGQTHTLVATVHAPANAGPAGSDYRVDLALAHRDGAQGAVDAAWTLTARLHVAEAQAPPLDAGMVWVLLGAAGAVAAGAAGFAAVRRLRAGRPSEWL
jgi:hypothetical protein